MKNVCLLGATGSIGSQVLEVMDTMPGTYRLKAMAFGENIAVGKEIIAKHQPEFVSCRKENDALELRQSFPKVKFGFGEEGLSHVATYETDNPVVINSLVGSAGLVPTVKAIEAGRDVLLANKETLVVAGSLVKELCKKNNVRLIPIDSEHSAIFQLLMGNRHEDVKRIILTASGGPFRNLSRHDLEHVTKADALRHPNWKMGAKITIDSATMMNKGFEVMEAYHLFDLPLEAIDVIIHPGSIVHSMVEFRDHSLFAQLGVSDMRIPIQFALTYPQHLPFSLSEPLDLIKVGRLEFETLDNERFPLVGLAKEALRRGGLYPAVLNASNEAAVGLFLKDRISFPKIEEIIVQVMNEVDNIDNPKLEEILETDRTIKEKINRKYNG